MRRTFKPRCLSESRAARGVSAMIVPLIIDESALEALYANTGIFRLFVAWASPPCTSVEEHGRDAHATEIYALARMVTRSTSSIVVFPASALAMPSSRRVFMPRAAAVDFRSTAVERS